MLNISLQALWRVIKLALAIQVVNVVIDYLVLISYEGDIPIWTFAALNVFYTLMIFAVKAALEKQISIAKIC